MVRCMLCVLQFNHQGSCVCKNSLEGKFVLVLCILICLYVVCSEMSSLLKLLECMYIVTRAQYGTVLGDVCMGL